MRQLLPRKAAVARGRRGPGRQRVAAARKVRWVYA